MSSTGVSFKATGLLTLGLPVSDPPLSEPVLLRAWVILVHTATTPQRREQIKLAHAVRHDFAFRIVFSCLVPPAV